MYKVENAREIQDHIVASLKYLLYASVYYYFST